MKQLRAFLFVATPVVGLVACGSNGGTKFTSTSLSTSTTSGGHGGAATTTSTATSANGAATTNTVGNTSSTGSKAATAATGNTAASTSGGTGGGTSACPPCLMNSGCATGSLCGQFAGDQYCAPDCSAKPCATTDRTCMPVQGADGHSYNLCVPNNNACGPAMSATSSASSAATTGSTAASTTSATSAASSTSGGTCAHSICSTGPKLTTGCDPCVTMVCGSDSFCCATNWDTSCVNEVGSICGTPCGGTGPSTVASTSAVASTSSAAVTSSAATTSSSGGTCAHSPCTTGAALANGCDACATTVCAGDSYCCSKQWDTQCVTEAQSACGASCSGTGPSSTSATTTTTTSSVASTAASSSGTTGFGPMGGTLPSLSFAIIGDTRPAMEDDTSGYPTAVINQIWSDVQAASPHVPFVITTGDYMFASPSHTPGTQSTQMGYYMNARNQYSGIQFPTMGNHECDGAVQDNCWDCSSTACNNVSGACISGWCQTPNFTTFAKAMLTPIGQSLPYYTININGPGNAWTSKFVFVACNAWSAQQATWLDQQLSTSTTYTFVVRHEGTIATTGPCLSGSGSMNADTIIQGHPLTLLIVGHTHTYAYYSSEKQVVVGNGGAPLSNSVNYGYVIARQSGSSIDFTSYDYQTNQSIGSFSVQ